LDNLTAVTEATELVIPVLCTDLQPHVSNLFLPFSSRGESRLVDGRGVSTQQPQSERHAWL